MFARFSAEAQEAVVFAREEAARLQHPWLGTEHLLLGLLRRTDTAAGRALASLGVTFVAAERSLLEELGPPPDAEVLGDKDEHALRSLGIDLQEVRRRVEGTFGPGALEQSRPGRCGVPVMPRLKQSLERAASAAGGGSIDSNHVLLGLVQVRGTMAMCVLERLEVSADAIRTTIEEVRRRAS